MTAFRASSTVSCRVFDCVQNFIDCFVCVFNCVQNFIDCFVSPDFGFNLESSRHWRGRRYEILNSTAINHIVLPNDQDGIFVFNVKVVEPHYR